MFQSIRTHNNHEDYKILRVAGEMTRQNADHTMT